MKVEGRQVKFDDGRIVFLARHPEKLRTWCLAFKNNDRDTLLILSDEAMGALISMYHDENVGTPPSEFPFHKEIEMRWVAVETN